MLPIIKKEMEGSIDPGLILVTGSEQESFSERYSHLFQQKLRHSCTLYQEKNRDFSQLLYCLALFCYKQWKSNPQGLNKKKVLQHRVPLTLGTFEPRSLYQSSVSAFFTPCLPLTPGELNGHQQPHTFYPSLTSFHQVLRRKRFGPSLETSHMSRMMGSILLALESDCLASCYHCCKQGGNRVS